MDNEDYLGITSLALSYLAESFIDSTDSAKVKQVLMVYVTRASVDWINNKERIRDLLLTEVKFSINESVKWVQKKLTTENRKHEWVTFKTLRRRKRND